MQYQNVCLEAFAYTLPEEIVTSEQIETWLEPLYTRLRLPEGRLELMTGIRQRRFWERGAMPGDKSVLSAEKAIRAAGLDKRHIGALIHGSVCRDYLEPATAAGVHHQLDLPDECLVHDTSNACLGLMNGIVEVANMIELGQIRAAVVVGTESARPLVETTIKRLNSDTSLKRSDVKWAVASLTIGSASAAVVLVDRELSRTGNRLLAAVAGTHSSACRLCHSGQGSDSGGGDAMSPLMWTDSENLMKEGVRAATKTLPRFLDEVDWSLSEIDKAVCHQVGRAHHKLLFDSLSIDPGLAYNTLEFLGNTGSVALPISAAMGVENGHLRKNDRVAMMGIGSGISVLMLGVDWQTSLIDGAEAPCQQQAAESPVSDPV